MIPSAKPTHDLYLNPAQLRCILADPKELFAFMGRGTGKSTELLGHLTLNRVFDMPRATFLILGRTYKQLLTRTLPGTVLGWEKRGMVEGTHFVIGKKPPESWPRSFFSPIDDFSHFISWYTGTGFALGSQDRAGLVNSLTVWGIFGDEAKLLLGDRFKEDAAATNRGSMEAFPGNPHNRGLWLTSSMPSLPEGAWLYDMEFRMNPDQMQDILKLSYFIESLKQKLSITTKETPASLLVRKIKYYTGILSLLRKDSVYYEETSSLANIHILRPDHIKQMRDILKGKFRSEILNFRPKHAENSFYPKLTASHFYNDFNYSYYDSINSRDVSKHVNWKGDNDLVSTRGLILGMDFGARINCIVTAQSLNSIRELRFVNNHFVVSPQIVDDVCDAWTAYYDGYPTREMEIYYDNTGNNRVPNSRYTYAQQAKAIFERKGWSVSLRTKGGTNPFHDKKFILWNNMLSENDSRFFRIRINESNCYELKQSMHFAPSAESTSGGVTKDKSSERKKSLPAEEATDLSDAADSIVWGMFARMINLVDVSYLDVNTR